MVQIKSIKNEDDYKELLRIESMICNEDTSVWHRHFGGIGVDRYFFGNGKNDIFHYGKLICNENESIGYALVYNNECEFAVELLSKWKDNIIEVVQLIEKVFKKGDNIRTCCNDEIQLKKLMSIGYTEKGKFKFNASINLMTFEKVDTIWNEEKIRILKYDDINTRVEYSALPTGEKITKKMYMEYLQSEDSNSVLDYVVIDKKTGGMAGYYSWWLDKESNTAIINPVACLEAYRKRKISTRSIYHELNELKDKGFSYAYVDTDLVNLPAVNLYKSVGFKQSKNNISIVKSL